jgi:endonuclease YncB( thermonuclease family)
MNARQTRALALALAALVLASSTIGGRGGAPDAPTVLSGRVEVTDGDTLALGGERIRLFGIDAPERGQECGAGRWACGDAATDRLRALVAAGPLRCTLRDRDRYGRAVATCTVGGVDVADRLVAEGLARAYTRYGADYAATEARARLERIGLWRSRTQAPWDYRAGRETPPDAAEAEAAALARGCRVKGNVSATGARLYHLPGSRSYAATRIDPARGEAWFCDAAEARAAGFRPAVLK